MSLIFLVPFTFLTLVSVGSQEVNSYHDSSDDFIEAINAAQSLWKAGKNFPDDTPIWRIGNMLGSFSGGGVGNLRRDDNVIDEGNVTIPDSFDARTNWPLCAEVIGYIGDQSNCKSGWAVSAASAMSDRLCIHTDGQKAVILSAGNILSCSFGFQCMGGWTIEAWRYWQQFGVVSGGNYGTDEGCQPYPLPPCDHYSANNETSCKGDAIDPECYKTCTNSSSLLYEEDLTFGVSSYWVYPNVTQLQLEIMLNGPVTSNFVVYSDFVNYKSGVYVRVNDSIAYDTHSVKLFGWGNEAGVDYWLAANSWNSNWGDGGFFKILRGEDHCGIESEATAGMPNATYTS